MRESSQRHKCGSAAIAMLLSLGLCATSSAGDTGTPVTVSQFQKEVRKERYKEVEPPSEAPIFRWDFSEAEVVHTYTFEDEQLSITDMGKSARTREEISSTGVLYITSQGDGTAELVIKDWKHRVKIDRGGKEPTTMELPRPPFVLHGMQEDGAASFGNSSQDAVLKMLFPLPPKALKVGESVDVPARRSPTHALLNAELQVTGRSRITLARYVKIGNRTCAQLDVDTDISEVSKPNSPEGDYRSSTKETSVFYFDLASRTFVSTTIALRFQVTLDAPATSMGNPGGDTSYAPKRVKASKVTDLLVRAKLKE